MWKNRFKKSILILGTLFFLSLIFQSQFYRLKSKQEIPSHLKEELIKLGNIALKTKDVPVSAVLIYEDSIIGTGYNTVKKDKTLSGHAEINALNMAFENYGNNFHKLNRAKLKLYSSFEPCEMCKGTFIHYNIQNIYFEKTKPFFHQVNSSFKSYTYELSKNRLDADSLQEKLFLKHPDYPKYK